MRFLLVDVIFVFGIQIMCLPENVCGHLICVVVDFYGFYIFRIVRGFQFLFFKMWNVCKFVLICQCMGVVFPVRVWKDLSLGVPVLSFMYSLYLLWKVRPASLIEKKNILCCSFL